MIRTLAGSLTVFLLCGCGNPEGEADRFLAEAAKRAEDARGKVPPLPALKPRDVAPLAIERDPFRR